MFGNTVDWLRSAWHNAKARIIYGESKLVRSLMSLAAPVSIALFSPSAWAFKLSTFGETWKSEAASLLPVVMLIIAGICVLVAGTAVISAIFAKKNQRPLEWQIWGVVGGAIGVVIPLIILAFSGSLTGNETNASGTLNELNLKI